MKAFQQQGVMWSWDDCEKNTKFIQKFHSDGLREQNKTFKDI